jgi:exocyst complex component 4
MTDEQCVPVQIALQLMDSSSLGRAYQYEQFQETYKALQKALKAIVNEHHQGFNSSIGTFHKIQSSIQVSQSRLRMLKESLIVAKGNLSTTKPELKILATNSRSYDDMLHILGQIEQLQHVPERLEARISEKRFLTAVEILQEALRTVRRSELENIGALSELKAYLANQESSLSDILIEELHNHLYLKSPYCQGRWKIYQKGDNKPFEGITSKSINHTRPLFAFLETNNLAELMIEDGAKNPEADSLSYIRLLLESLNQLGHLENAISAIDQRMPIELFKVVDKTNIEVDQRHPLGVRSTQGDSRGKSKAFGDNDFQSVIIYDLLWTLYSKFEAIAEGHRVVHDVVTNIARREDMLDTHSLTKGFKELWKLYQSEIRSILHDYLATDGKASYDSNQSASGVASLFQKKDRDRSKRMFKLQDMDMKSADVVSEREDLDSILKSSVPGLVSSSKRAGEIGLSDTNQADGSATGHKLLIEPSVFNMGLLLPPSLAFLQRLKEIVPAGADIVISTLTSFLDDFLVNVFLPQLEETLTDLTSQSYRDMGAFQEDPHWPSISRKPILKGTSTFYNLTITFCRMLDTIPQDQAFSELIISQMISYYNKCYDWYKSLVVRVQVDLPEGVIPFKRSAALLEISELRAIMLENWTAGKLDEGLIERENYAMIGSLTNTPIEQSELLSDRKATASLCLLYNSMNWLVSRLSQLRNITSHTDVLTTRQAKHNSDLRWATLDPSKRHGYGGAADVKPVYLPLSEDNASTFDGAMASYSELATTSILTLHAEVRCHAAYYLDASLHDGNYNLDSPVHETDPRILALNAGLLNFDEDVAHYLGRRETSSVHQSHHSQSHSSYSTSSVNSDAQLDQQDRDYDFLLRGLGHFADNILVAHANKILIMNADGGSRMVLHILVLQQNLKNVEPKALMERSNKYYNLFIKGPEAILSYARAQQNSNSASGGHQAAETDDRGRNDHLELSPKSSGIKNKTRSDEKGQFSYDNCKTLLELYFSTQLRGSRRDSALQARRQLNELISELGAISWQS